MQTLLQKMQAYGGSTLDSRSYHACTSTCLEAFLERDGENETWREDGKAVVPDDGITLKGPESERYIGLGICIDILEKRTEEDSP